MKTERELFEEYMNKTYPLAWLNKVYLNDDTYACVQVDNMWQTWQASASRKGYKLVPVEASKELSDKLEDMASCQPSYDGIDIYKVAIGELDYDWKTGTKAMIGAVQGNKDD